MPFSSVLSITSQASLIVFGWRQTYHHTYINETFIYVWKKRNVLYRRVCSSALINVTDGMCGQRPELPTAHVTWVWSCKGEVPGQEKENWGKSGTCLHSIYFHTVTNALIKTEQKKTGSWSAPCSKTHQQNGLCVGSIKKNKRIYCVLKCVSFPVKCKEWLAELVWCDKSSWGRGGGECFGLLGLSFWQWRGLHPISYRIPTEHEWDRNPNHKKILQSCKKSGLCCAAIIRNQRSL